MIPIGAITPLNASYTPIFWTSRAAALAAIVFAVAAVAELIAAPLALNLAFGCTVVALIAQICLSRGGELAMIRQIGSASVEERKLLDYKFAMKHGQQKFQLLLQSIETAAAKGEDRFRYFEQCDTEVTFAKTPTLEALAGYSQRNLDDLLSKIRA